MDQGSLAKMTQNYKKKKKRLKFSFFINLINNCYLALSKELLAIQAFTRSVKVIAF